MDMEDERRPALEDNGALPGMQLNEIGDDTEAQ